MKKILLLNSTDEVLAFISEKKAIKLLYKNKVEVVSTWLDETFFFKTEIINFPAILRLKYFIKRKYTQIIFSRKSVFKRDKFICQYCEKKLKPGYMTVDHVIPRSSDGASSFYNCVTACYGCNNKKGNRTLEQANMNLINKPDIPPRHLSCIPILDEEQWHEEWYKFI